jgi:hypothetical protein
VVGGALLPTGRGVGCVVRGAAEVIFLMMLLLMMLVLLLLLLMMMMMMIHDDSSGQGGLLCCRLGEVLDASFGLPPIYKVPFFFLAYLICFSIHQRSGHFFWVRDGAHKLYAEPSHLAPLLEHGVCMHNPTTPSHI